MTIEQAAIAYVDAREKYEQAYTNWHTAKGYEDTYALRTARDDAKVASDNCLVGLYIAVKLGRTP